MIILTDNREQHPWDFTPYGFQQEFTTVKTGDYTIKGMENDFVVERKASTLEISLNFGQKWKPFTRELKRMQDIPHRYIICEFPMSYIYDFPKNSQIPRYQWKELKLTSAFLAKRVEEIISEYDVNVIFSNSRLEAQMKFMDLINEL